MSLSIQGYASLFWARDLGGDIVAAGAFADSLAIAGRAGLPMLHGHDEARPIGRWTEAREDSRGLFVRGRIDPSTPAGRRAATLVEAGRLDGLSIGFRARRARRAPYGRERVLAAVDLLEISLVPNPMLPGARLIAPSTTFKDPA